MTYTSVRLDKSTKNALRIAEHATAAVRVAGSSNNSGSSTSTAQYTTSYKALITE
jgi:hypothetical protein